MHRRTLNITLLVVIGLITGACAPAKYIPSEYAIDAKRIPPLETKGTIEVHSGDALAETVKVYQRDDGSVSVESSYKLMTDAVVKQLKLELFKRGGNVADGGGKSFKVTVTQAEAKSSLLSFKATMNVTVALGNGITQNYVIRNTSTGSIPRTLNGTIARAVINILNNETVQEYLKN